GRALARPYPADDRQARRPESALHAGRPLQVLSSATDDLSRRRHGYRCVSSGTFSMWGWPSGIPARGPRAGGNIATYASRLDWTRPWLATNCSTTSRTGTCAWQWDSVRSSGTRRG